MVPSEPKKQRRNRGVILTSKGLEKLDRAKTEAEFKDNFGNRYTLEALSERTKLAVDTLMKVLAADIGVDRKTLKKAFSAFGLTLDANDFYQPQLQPPEPKNSFNNEPEVPEGQISLTSSFYVERPHIEQNCYKAILQAGALVRIKASRRMGKTSLMTRILDFAEKEGYKTVPIQFDLADQTCLQSLDKFLQWFCANINLNLNIPNRVSQYWNDLFGSKVSCKLYLEQYLLAKIDRPLVLAFDDADWLFQYPDLADGFFSLLRAWHEEAKNREIWKKLRLLVVHSTEVYIPLNVNQSPFNVGVPIEIPEFTVEQIQDLAKRYGFDWSLQEIQKLMTLVGGHPYLISIALYNFWSDRDKSKNDFSTFLGKLDRIYSDHLQRQLTMLQKKPPETIANFVKIVLAEEPIELDLLQAFQLQSWGLVRLIGDRAASSCQLYQQYFRAHFRNNSQSRAEF
jgi:hypothetical protein